MSSPRPCNELEQASGQSPPAVPDPKTPAPQCTSSARARSPPRLISVSPPYSAPHRGELASNRSGIPSGPHEGPSKPQISLRFEASSRRGCSSLHLIKTKVHGFIANPRKSHQTRGTKGELTAIRYLLSGICHPHGITYSDFTLPPNPSEPLSEPLSLDSDIVILLKNSRNLPSAI